uniref:Uncharacterized protein n=1 Tax=Steinernema glaseri TaxID=37863 RepID=A0A1I7YNG2_9BILA
MSRPLDESLEASPFIPLQTSTPRSSVEPPATRPQDIKEQQSENFADGAPPNGDADGAQLCGAVVEDAATLLPPEAFAEFRRRLFQLFDRFSTGGP